MNEVFEPDFLRIPEELRALDQWVVAGPDKRPHDPKTMRHASVREPSTWGTFKQAMLVIKDKGPDWFPGLVLTQATGVTVIDLDDKPDKPLTDEQRQRHKSMLELFNTYTERSRNKRGYHIIARATIPSGVHRDSVEMYSDGRYIIFTGDVVKDAPISAAYQQELTNMYSQMKPAQLQAMALTDGDPELTLWDDRDLVERVMAASNAEKFNALCRGELDGPYEEGPYPSDSEADMALLSILAFYSPDNDQCRRVFSMSTLGQRDKHQKGDYHINLCLKKIRSSTPPEIDRVAIAKAAAAAIEKAKTSLPSASPTRPCTTPVQAPQQPALTLPPGLVGSLTQYFLSSANRPLREVALHAAIALMATICGRSFCTFGSPTGLNLYLVLVAQTGMGKEDGKQGIRRVLNHVQQRIPSAYLLLGPSMFASGQALHKQFDQQHNFLWINGEIGHHLQRITSSRAVMADLALQRTLLDLYSSSGPHGMLGAHVHSNSEMNSAPVRSPAMTMMGETTPEVFYKCLNDASISSGLIPRFLVVEYQGQRPLLNPNAGHAPSDDLVEDIATFVERALRIEATGEFVTVKPDAEAKLILDDFNKACDAAFNAGDTVAKDLWVRAHLNAVKVACVIAVGINSVAPEIDAVAAHWAVDFVRRCVGSVLARFDTGDAGQNPLQKGEIEIRRWITKFLAATPAQRAQLDGVSKAYCEGDLIPYNFLLQNLKGRQPFKDDKRLFKELLDELVKGDVLESVPLGSATIRNGARGAAYVVGQAW